MDRMRVSGQVAFGFQSMYVPVLRWFVSPACLVVVDVVQPVLVAEGLVLDVSHRVKPCRKGLCQLYWFVAKVSVTVAKLLLATVRITDALPKYSPKCLGGSSEVRPHCQGGHGSPLSAHPSRWDVTSIEVGQVSYGHDTRIQAAHVAFGLCVCRCVWEFRNSHHYR